MKTIDMLEGLASHAPRWPVRKNIGGLNGVGFAGGGGSSIGLKRAGLKIDFAMNHDAAAIAMHAANCPEAEHFCQDIWQVRPEEVRPGEPIRFMWFSPDCKHFSKAKGGKPVEKKIRDLAWVIVLWAKIRRPDVIVMENVEEFVKWGPLDAEGQPIKEREGEYFRAFCREFDRLNYIHEFVEIRSCDHGDPTTRNRVYGQFRCDGEPIRWPTPSFGAPTDPRVISGELQPWRTAASHVIDWSQPVYSIFLTRNEVRERKLRLNRPLVDATLGRVTLGLQRFVLEAGEPYIVPITHQTWANRAWTTEEPLRSQTCAKGGEHALAVPSLTPLTHHGPPRAHSVEEPTRTMTNANRGEIAMQAAHLVKFRADNAGAPVTGPAPAMTANSYEKRPGGAAPIGLAAASMIQTGYGEREGQEPRALDTQQPIGCQVAGGAKHAVVANYIASTGGGEYAGRPRAVGKPINTMTVENRQGIVAAHITAQYGASVGHAADDPTGAQTAMAHHGVIAAHMIQNNGGEVGHPIDKPTSTLCSKVGHHAIAASHLMHLRGQGERPGNDDREPVVAQTAGGTHVAEVRTFLVKYYQSAEHGQPVGEPIHAQTTKARFGLVEVATSDVDLTDEQRYTAYWVARLIDVFGHPDGLPKKGSRRKPKHGVKYSTLLNSLNAIHRQRPSAVGRDGWLVWDIGMRMLTVRERFRAQGVTDDFIIDVDVDGKPITATKQGEMCGNMVTPGTAEAIARAALPELGSEREAVAA